MAGHKLEAETSLHYQISQILIESKIYEQFSGVGKSICLID